MKKLTKFLTILLSAIMLLGLTACGESVEQGCYFDTITYEGINSISNIDKYQSEVSLYGNKNNHNPVENGVILSPYYTLKVGETEVPVYASRSAHGIHSFAFLDVIDTGDEGFNLNVEITGTENSTVFNNKKASCIVLPESTGVETELNRDDKTVKATIKTFGSFSFVFNEEHYEPLTVMVYEKQDLDVLFNDYKIKNIPVGDYSITGDITKTNFTAENTVYYFGAGKYKIHSIVMPSNSVLYLAPGAYIEVIPSRVEHTDGNKVWYDRDRAISVAGKENVVIAGRGIFDYSACSGSSEENWNTNDKDTFIISDSKNIKVLGLTAINAQHWTLCFYNSKNIQVKNVFFMAYRMYADGVMLSDCQDAVVEDSFIRTGDDAFETKSKGKTEMKADNILFQNNAAWTDKALAYGCVFESYNSTQNVTFKNCSVGFALGNWSDHLGCCVIQLGEKWYPDTVNENITFENIEIYSSHNNAILQCYVGGNPSKDELGAGTIKNIYFKNITAKTNLGFVLNLQTDNEEKCFIEDIYLDNIVSNDIEITSSNISKYLRDKVIGGYDLTKLHINTRG